MNERTKGRRLDNFEDDYIVFDLETTSVRIYEAKIIEIAAIKVKAGQIVDKYQTLINPGMHIPSTATAVNNITDFMVEDAPFLEEILDDFLAFIGMDILVGHNITTFDLNILYDEVKRYKGINLENDYVDTYYMARKCISGLDNYRLSTICQYYGINAEGAHRALKDCYLTKECFEKLRQEYKAHGYVNCNKANSASRQREWKYSDETKALQQLQGFLMGIVADNVLTVEEIQALKIWLDSNISLKGNYPFDRVFIALEEVLEDGIIEAKELEFLLDLFKKFTAPMKEKEDIKITNIVGKHCCLTGKFSYGEKDEIKHIILDKGGLYDETIKKDTDYLVVGALGSEKWTQGTYGGKIKKAMEWKEKGNNIQIVSEEVFLKELEKINNEESKVKNGSIENETIMMQVDMIKEEGSWKRKIQDMLEELVNNLELPNNSLYLAKNVGRVSNDITSYSVCIYEAEYPEIPNKKMEQTRNSVVMNIREKTDKLELIISSKQYKGIEAVKGLEIKILNPDTKNLQILIDKNDEALIEIIKICTKFSVKNYTSKASTFGCCSRFVTCSDMKKCVHENQLYSRACSYRKHLEAGRIFYGKDKNID